jgi:hypothetical protein
MADHANDEGWFYAGQNSLARKARCSVEYVRQTVMQMVDDGTLIIEKKGSGKGKATEYRLLPFTPNSVGENNPPKSVGEPPNSDPQLPNFDSQLPNSTPNQPSLQPSNTTKTLVPATVVAPNAGTIITAWIEGLRVRPPDRVVGQTAREVRLLLDQGYDPALVLEALRSISGKGLHPSTLASELNTILNPPTTMRGGASTADQRLNGLKSLLVGSDRGTA